ncbi:acyltransferase [Mucilaginibacter sp. BJC16-A38]|uniref:acyltransferase family protein n=1 Tax=Mucilaginibacter phenanthrenivorans TaxID=1234842 RepID=UPI002157A687|nr:acyltransferase [Mucilaginibacter phenanthrenivorans]MCR8560179.1 acyltransferase [Mucilaginibacter phenanthrenivorans]
MSNRKNAFDLLRVLLAIGVLFNHAIVIGGYRLIDPLALLSKNQSNLGEFCVMGFFTLSGFLITASFERTHNLLLFASHRLLRIVPGFLVSLLVTGFIISPLIFMITGRALAAFAFTGPESAASFFFRNMFFGIRQWSIRDVLNYSAYKESLDGSLWSLLPEIQCYVFTLIAGMLGLFDKNKVLLLITAIVTFIFFAINFNFSKTFGPTILILSPALKLYTAYLAGMLLHVFKDSFTLDKRGTVYALFFTLLLIKFGGYNIISPLLIALVLVNAFQLFEYKVKYDISYGIYIYGFPVQHLVHVLFGQRVNYLCFVGISVLAAAGLGLLSFIAVEKPFIKFRRYTDPLMASFKN